MKYTIQHSDWSDELYGWQVLSNGQVIDTYEDKNMAIAYVDYMNDKIETEANDSGELRAMETGCKDNHLSCRMAKAKSCILYKVTI